MPIPPFDASGNLSVGDYIRNAAFCQVEVGLGEIRDRFVDGFPDDRKRRAVWEGWMRHRQALAKVGLPFVTWVDGSFTTTKHGPNDVDLALLMDGVKLDKVTPRIAAILGELLDVETAKGSYLCHPQLIPVYPFGHKRFRHVTSARHDYWTRVFGTDKHSGAPKAILVVSGSEVI